MRPHRLSVVAGLCCLGCSPSLVLLAPAEGDELFEAAWVRAEAEGAVSFYLDEVDEAHALGVGEPDEDRQAAVLWFTDGAANGPHTLIAEASIGGKTRSATLEVQVANIARGSLLGADALKMTPELDAHPPELEPAFAELFEAPVPLEGPVTTAGAEDSAYVTADGSELFFFYTPDGTIPANEQLVDRVSGIWRSEWTGGGWGEPSRVVLNTWDDPSLDGCGTIYEDLIWFCTARAGVQREIDLYTARRDGAHFVDWQSAGERLNLDLLVGELHLSDGGEVLTFHSEREEGTGGLDLWQTTLDGGEWGDAVELAALNTGTTDGWPWVSEDGLEIWFTTGAGAPEIWRAQKEGGEWQPPEKVVGPFAGEPTFDAEGNLLFTHHFWDDASNTMIEADLYIARHR